MQSPPEHAFSSEVILAPLNPNFGTLHPLNHPLLLTIIHGYVHHGHCSAELKASLTQAASPDSISYSGWVLREPAIAHVLSNALVYVPPSPSSIPVKDMSNGLPNSPIMLGLSLRLIQQVSGQNTRLFVESQEIDSGVAQGR